MHDSHTPEAGRNRIFADERELSEEPDICGAAVDLINAEVSPVEGVSIATIFIEPGKVTKAHFHKTMEEIYYFISGCGRVSVGDRVYEVYPGTAVGIAIGEVHQVSNTGRERLKFISADSPSFLPADIYYP